MTSPESSGLTPRGHGLPDDEARASDEIGLVELVTTLLKHWRATIAFPLALGFVTGLVSLVLPLTYTATTTFVPEKSAQGRLPSSLAGIASQFGITAGAEASQSPRFYARVVRSRELMEHVLLTRYLDPRQKQVANDSATLLVILGVPGRDSADRLQRGIRKLHRLVSVIVDDRTNIVSLQVDAHYPALAAAVANGFVEYLNAFNTQYRQSQARGRRLFVEQRVAEGQRDLRTAEEDLRTFYERNHSWRQSPQLVFEEGRIRRQVEIRQEVYLTLRREYETARIEEVNDTPVITVVDSAVPPVQKSGPKRALLVVLGLVLGGIVGALWAASVEYIKHVRNERKELYEDFSTLLRSVRSEIRRALRALIPGKT